MTKKFLPLICWAPALITIVAMYTVVNAEPQKASEPHPTYFLACSAMAGEISLRDSGILSAQQKDANNKRIKYLVELIEKFKP